MTPNVAEVLEAARSLSPAERADLAQEIVLSIGDDVDDASRLVTLRRAIDQAVESIDAGEGIHVPAGETRGFVGEIGREAVRIAAAKTA